MVQPYTSVYAWPDGKTFTCFVFIDSRKAKSYQITGELAQSIYPSYTVHAAVRAVAINRFSKSED